MRDKSRKAIELANPNLQWFYKQFGSGTSLSWYLNLLMTKSRELYENNRVEGGTPVAVATKTAEEVRDELIERGIL